MKKKILMGKKEEGSSRLTSEILRRVRGRRGSPEAEGFIYRSLDSNRTADSRDRGWARADNNQRLSQESKIDNEILRNRFHRSDDHLS